MTFTNFLMGLPAMLLCLIVQVAVAFWCVRYYVGHPAPVGSGQGFLAGIRPLIVATLALMVGNLVQIMLWGGLFLWLGEFEQAYDAIYHSAVNFTSLGYGDIVMSRERRLLGPLEAVNGVLMLGMSAATLMAIVQHMIKMQAEAERGSRLDPVGRQNRK
ncbi:MAG: two pore domain potassium channel family protein [Betaproteobacteria bacterium]|nr:two pore domain potassium channel family protein [Betaproteobacteria bacterium]